MGKVKNSESEYYRNSEFPNPGARQATEPARGFASRALFLPLLGLLFAFSVNCGGCSDQELRLVRMVSDTALYSEPSRSADRLGTVPSGQLVEIVARGEPDEDSERVWYEVKWKKKQGFLLLDPARLEMNTVTSDSEKDSNAGDTDGDDTDGIEESGELELKPKRLKPASFDPENLEFSLGLGCTGSTHSEYSVSISFRGDEVRMVDSGLLEYGMPGEACGSTYEEIFVGEYDVDDKEITASFKKRISRVSTANFPNCDATKVKEETQNIQRNDRFFMLECDGKKALQMDPAMAAQGSDDPEAHSYSDQYFVVE